MEEKNTQKLFREKSLEEIDSPESMNDYLQVTSPSVWLVLGAVIAVLIGAILWSIFGRINTSVKVAVISKDGDQACYVPYEKMEEVISSGIVFVNDQPYMLQLDQETQTIIISENSNPYICVAGNLQIGDVAVEVPLDSNLQQGVYSGTVITESLQPITLLLQ